MLVYNVAHHFGRSRRRNNQSTLVSLELMELLCAYLKCLASYWRCYEVNRKRHKPAILVCRGLGRSLFIVQAGDIVDYCGVKGIVHITPSWALWSAKRSTWLRWLRISHLLRTVSTLQHKNGDIPQQIAPISTPGQQPTMESMLVIWGLKLRLHATW